MLGPLLAFTAAILFGLSSPLAKALLGNTDPWLLAGLLYLGSGLGMLVTYILRALRFPKTVRTHLVPQDWLWLLGITFWGGVVGPVLMLYGLSRTPASSASLLLNLEGVFTAILAWSFFREHCDRRIILGMGAIVLGSAFLSWPGTLSYTGIAGPFFICGACLSWAIDNNLTRKISLHDPILLTLLKSLIAGSTNLGIAFVLGAQHPALNFALRAGFLGYVCYGLSLVCFILALRHLGASRTGAYFSAAPFVGTFVAIVFWKEPISWNLIVAALFMGFGLYLHLSEDHQHEHRHEEMEHAHSHHHDEHHQHEHGALDSKDEPHVHPHRHTKLFHKHAHYPDMHHDHIH